MLSIFNWYDPNKYDLVIKDEYKEQRINNLKAYRDYLQDRIADIDAEIKKLEGK